MREIKGVTLPNVKFLYEFISESILSIEIIYTETIRYSFVKDIDKPLKVDLIMKSMTRT